MHAKVNIKLKLISEDLFVLLSLGCNCKLDNLTGAIYSFLTLYLDFIKNNEC